MQFSFLRTICSRGLRLKTWDHALSHPSCHSSRLLYDGFCWTAVSCEPLTLGTHTDRILNYQLPHSPTHDLNVLGGKKGLLGVECKEGAVTFSAIRPFTNHHWPLEGAQPNMESWEWVLLPCPTPPPKQGSFSTPEAQSAHWIAMPACQWWSPECAQLKALSPRCHAISMALTKVGCLSHMSLPNHLTNSRALRVMMPLCLPTSESYEQGWPHFLRLDQFLLFYGLIETKINCYCQNST